MDIYLMLGGLYFGKGISRGTIMVSQADKKVQQQRGDEELGKFAFVEIFILHLEQDAVEDGMGFGKGLRGDVDWAVHHGADSGKAFDAVEQGEVKEKYKPVSAFRRNQGVHLSGRNYQYLPRLNMEIGLVRTHIVVVFHREDNLQRRVPMGAVAVGLVVIPDTHGSVIFISNQLVLILIKVSRPIVIDQIKRNRIVGNLHSFSSFQLTDIITLSIVYNKFCETSRENSKK